MSTTGVVGPSGPAIPARVQAITARLAHLRSTGANSPGAGAPLGFGLILEQQQAGTAQRSDFGWSTDLRPARPASSGSYGTLTPPAELTVYGNGRIPPEALEPVGVGDHRLWAPAASAMRSLIADAQADGVHIGMTDSYRPLAVQERLAREKGLYSQGGLAAVPGTSNHGWGLATDLDLDDRALSWMRENAWRYGFVEDVPREPWHWTYRPG